MNTNTIINQLGGNKFQTMTGANMFVATENGIQFSFKGCKTANKCRITLRSDDTYNVEFFKLNRKEGTCPLTKEIEMVYAENLQNVFESATGLYVTL